MVALVANQAESSEILSSLTDKSILYHMQNVEVCNWLQLNSQKELYCPHTFCKPSKESAVQGYISKQI